MGLIPEIVQIFLAVVAFLAGAIGIAKRAGENRNQPHPRSK